MDVYKYSKLGRIWWINSITNNNRNIDSNNNNNNNNQNNRIMVTDNSEAKESD
jgi:hypothetical protein